jgi:hypothetical protein
LFFSGIVFIFEDAVDFSLGGGPLLELRRESSTVNHFKIEAFSDVPSFKVVNV